MKLRKELIGSAGFVVKTVFCTAVFVVGCKNDDPVKPSGISDEKKSAKQQLQEMRQERKKLDLNVWADEVNAQEHEQYFVRLWDRLRFAKNKMEVLAQTVFDQIQFSRLAGNELLELGIRKFVFGGEQQTLDRAGWNQLLTDIQTRGYRILECEFHHSRFRPGQRSSEVSFVFHVIRSAQRKTTSQPQVEQRIILRGTLEVNWASDRNPDKIRVNDLVALTRTGPPAFRHVLTYSRTAKDFASAHPILLYDLDRNGFPEIILSRWNRVYWNQGKGQFREALFLDKWIPIAESGMIADVDSNGTPDLVTVDVQGRLLIFDGNEDGKFKSAGRKASDIRASAALAMTAGDIDSDGDLDLWLTQYKPSYLEGQMPTPYYDANDGEPSYLLINDGNGFFRDETESRNLAKKRHRRTYSTSFIDLDEDRDQDLLVVSDYAGVDIYFNNGQGVFSDVTDQQVDESHLFGMAHTFADFNQDQKLDFYVIGMSSTTARRLDLLGARRTDRADIHQMRPAMGYGNRMFLKSADRFREPKFASQVARTGWSWGTTSFDFDLDGDRDIYVANGFRSGKSCRDYCTQFWRHDIYTGSSTADPNVESLFSESMRDLDQGAMSWNGYEHNVLLMNRKGDEFVSVAFLFGVSFEYDSRAVVGNDLDGDGRPDLVVAEYRFVGQGYVLDLHIYQNMLQTGNHWIGIRLPTQPDPIGAKVTLFSDVNQVGRVTTGDSFLAQHAPILNFGLGKNQRVQKVIVEWPNGAIRTLVEPTIDRYHDMIATGK